MAILEFARRCVAWLRRCGHSRGFGIQSPTAYQFVTDVLCQRLPYHAYDDLSRRFPKLRGRRLKFCRLLFRLANYQQAERTFVASCFSEENLAFLVEGNRRSELVSNPANCRLIVASAMENQDLSSIVESLPDDAILVLTDIYFHGKEADFWQSVKASKRVAMTFDCYDCGMAILGETAYQQHYFVNL